MHHGCLRLLHLNGVLRLLYQDRVLRLLYLDGVHRLRCGLRGVLGLQTERREKGERDDRDPESHPGSIR